MPWVIILSKPLGSGRGGASRFMKYSYTPWTLVTTTGKATGGYCIISKVTVLVTQSCPALCNPMDCNSQASLSMGILQARILQWAAIPSSRGSSQPGKQPRAPALQAESLPSEPPGKALHDIYYTAF